MLRLRTFGSVDLQGPDDRDLRSVLAQPKRLALLIYLAVARPSGVHRRDELLALFWPDLDDARARDALNQALRFLRQALGPDTFVRRGGEDIGVDPAVLWCDSAAFQSALDEGRPAEAMELYQGDFLQGFFIEEGGGFEEWMDRERSALRESAARGARQLAEEHASGGALTLAIDWGRRALELAPDDERALRRLLRLHDKAGDRAGAFRLYDAFVRRFEEEFGCAPAPETKALAERLKAGLPLEDASAKPLAESPRPFAKAPTAEIGNRYRIIRKLGAGGMATVYLALDVKHDREVALKVLKPEIAEGLARERFLREIRIAGQLQHPNIVPLFDSGEADGRLYFVMAHIQGETLRERLTREKRFEIPEVVHLLREVAGALAYAHERGVIHRDIKPENILLIDRRAVLADFGIARAAHAARTPMGTPDETLTMPGTSLGTPAYMSPEQAAGNPEIDQRADLYALGVLGYEMLAGRPPFVGLTGHQVLAAHLLEAPVPVEQLRTDTPAGLGALVMRCLEKQPAGRPRSADVFLAELEDGASVARSAPVGKQVRRMATLGALVAGAVAVILIFDPSGPALPTGSVVPEEVTQIAVRPFADLSPERVLGHIAEGLTADLISELARIPLLRVRSATALAPLRKETPDSIRRVLGVGTLIEGSVNGDRDSLRLSVAIVLASTGDELAHKKWVMSRDRLFALEDSLVTEVGRFIRDWLGSEIRSQQRRQATRNVQAWEHYQMGNSTFQEANRLYRNGETVTAFKLLTVADSLFSQAEAADPSWLDPILTRGWIDHWRAVNYASGGSDTSVQWSRESIRQAERVLARNPDHPEARELRGTAFLQMAIDGRGDSSSLATAVRDLRRSAVPANPFHARAWYSLGTALRWQGRSAEANVAARRAYELDAFMERADDLLEQLCATSFELSQLADANGWCAEGRLRFPKKFAFPYYLLQMMPLSKTSRPNIDSAWALLRELERTTPSSDWSKNRASWQMMVASALARAGLTDSARRVLAGARRIASDSPDVDVYDAAALTALGDHAAAIDRLRSYLSKNPLMRPVVGAHPSFASLANDPGFRRMVGAHAKDE